MNTNITDPRFSENPFEPAEIQYAFECQKDKKPFEIRKETKMQSGHKKELSIKGSFIPENFREIWNGDDFIVYFNYEYGSKGNTGGGYAKNRFDTMESLRAEMFSAFKLTEKAQLSLFKKIFKKGGTNMGYELINRITVKKDGVYISSHSNNDTAPFISHRVETLSKVYAEEGQKGLDREIFRMIYEYAELRGSHKSIVRYQRVMDCAEGRELYNDYLKETNAKYVALSAEEPITCGSESDKKYEEYDKRLKNNLYIAYAGLAALLDKCYGCAHIGFRFPYASMHPCCNCTRSHTIDYYESKDTEKKPVKKAVKPKADFLVLNAELPMTSAMFIMLVNNYVNTTEKCCSCLHCNGECGDFAKAGTCKAMDERINDVLVFHTGEIEFATTREKISKMLEAQHQSDYDGYIPETVSAVIEGYINWGATETDPFAGIGKENCFAASLYKNLKDDVFGAIIYELDWSKVG